MTTYHLIKRYVGDIKLEDKCRNHCLITGASLRGHKLSSADDVGHIRMIPRNSYIVTVKNKSDSSAFFCLMSASDTVRYMLIIIILNVCYI